MCPDVPTVVELGMPDMVSAVFYGLVGAGRRAASGRRPAERAVPGRSSSDPEVKKKFAELGYFTTG